MSIFDYRVTREFAGPRIVESDLLLEDYEDWSRVRSAARARRRLRHGHRQNITHRKRPMPSAIHDRINNVMYVHPVTLRAIRASLTAKMNADIMKAYRGMFSPEAVIS